jgi:hypothetical protein
MSADLNALVMWGLTDDDRTAIDDAVLHLRGLKEALRIFLNEHALLDLEDTEREATITYFLELIDQNVDAIDDTLETAQKRQRAQDSRTTPMRES